MIELIQYIRPSWYFNLTPRKGDIPYWLDIEKVPDEWKSLVTPCSCYRSAIAHKWDAAYQLWSKGVIASNSAWAINTSTPIPLSDQYRLIKRFYNPVWIYVVALLRILEFKNPISEFKGVWATRGIKKINPSKESFEHHIDQFESTLLNEKPLVSIIIPTLNRYKYLEDVLVDMDKQTYPNIEVLVVDQSEPFREEIYKNRKVPIQAWHQEEKALWLARNTAIKQSKGQYILLYDDDSLVEPDWVEQHLKCLDYFKCTISSGVSIAVVGASVPAHYSYYRWSDQIDTGNVMLHRSVFEHIGLFDRQFEKQRMGDGEFGLRAYLAGFKNISNPKAKRVHLKVSEGGLRQMGSWDAWRPKNFFAPRPIPSVLYLLRSYFGDAAARRNIILAILPSVVPYRFKNNKALLLLGTAIGILTLPLMSISVIRSWRLASVKCHEGPKVEKLV